MKAEGKNIFEGREKFSGVYKKHTTVDNYFSKRFGGPMAHASHLQEITLINKILRSIPPTGKILEIAPGPARLSTMISYEGVKMGIDRSREMLEVARERLQGKNWCLIEGDAFLTPFPRDSFNIVMMFRFFRHFYLQDRESLLTEVRRISKKGGFLVFEALNNNMPPLARRYMRIGQSEVYDELWNWDELKEELNNFGWEVVAVWPILSHFKISYLIDKLFSPFGRTSIIGVKLINLMDKISTKDAYQWDVLCRKI